MKEEVGKTLAASVVDGDKLSAKERAPSGEDLSLADSLSPKNKRASFSSNVDQPSTKRTLEEEDARLVEGWSMLFSKRFLRREVEVRPEVGVAVLGGGSGIDRRGTSGRAVLLAAEVVPRQASKLQAVVEQVLKMQINKKKFGSEKLAAKVREKPLIARWYNAVGIARSLMVDYDIQAEASRQRGTGSRRFGLDVAEASTGEGAEGGVHPSTEEYILGHTGPG